MKELLNLKPNTWADYIGATFLIAVFFFGIVFVWNATHKEVPTPTTARPIVECPKDFDSYEQTRKSLIVTLLENKESYGIPGDGFAKEYKVKLKRSGLNSEVACGYLFYRVSVDGRAIQQTYENLVMRPSDSRQFGGHIIPNKNVEIRNVDVNNKTEILLPLANITYNPNKGRPDTRSADWVALLNVADEMEFDIALNTTAQAGMIDEVSIAYKCWNPETGQETQDCELEVIK